MSVTDPQADPVQPEGQGGEGTGGDPPYADFLNRIPEEVRGEVEPVFRDWDAQTTQRFQEASEYRKAWEPYEGVGVNRYDPEAVQNALAFYEAVANDPQSVRQWYEEQYAPAHNLQPQPDQQQPLGDQFQEFGQFDPQQLAEMLNQHLTPIQQQLQEFGSWRQQQEEQAQIASGQQFMDQQIAELKSKHGDAFDDNAQQWVLSRAHSEYLNDPENAIPRAWQDLQGFMNAIEKAALQKKVDAPAPAEAGGVPDVTPDKIGDFKQAGEIAMQLLRNENRA